MMSIIIERLNGVGQIFVGWAGAMALQAGILILVLFLINYLLRNKVRAVIRYWLCVLILIKLVLPTSLSSPVSIGRFFGDRLNSIKVSERVFENAALSLPIRSEPTVETAVSDGVGETAADIENDAKVSEPVIYRPIKAVRISWPGVLFVGWCVAVILLVSVFLRRLIFIRRLVLKAREPEASMLKVLSCCMCQMGIKRYIRLKLSSELGSPAVSGFLRPTILIPENFVPHLESKQLEGILFHELAHIKRNDLWVIFFQSMLQIVYFYNPLVWLANTVIRRIREEAVDEAVMTVMGKNSQQYLRILIDVAKLAFGRPALSLGLTGVVEPKSDLSRRIKRMMNRPVPKKSRMGFCGALSVLVIGLILLPMAASKLDNTAFGDSEVTQANQTEQTYAKYSFRGTNSAVRVHSSKINPRTLNNSNPSPKHAIVLSKPLRWWSSHWGGNGTEATAIERFGNVDRFIVKEPYKAHIWVKYFDIPIDSIKYPRLILTYRAKGLSRLEGSEDYLLYLDDGSGPSFGGVLPFAIDDIISDGQKHVLVCNLNWLNPAGKIIGLSINVCSGGGEDAWFDLIDLRFEAIPGKPAEITDEDKSYTVKVIDASGKPIQGATVAIDAERKNWSKSMLTGADGMATLIPYKTESGRHMFRINKESMIPVEIRDIPEDNKTLIAVLEPAVTYGGFVVDEQGEPLTNAALKINVNYKGVGELWTRKDAEVLTNKDGFWESPLMPRPNSKGWLGSSFISKETEGIKISVAYPDYKKERCYKAVFAPPLNQLEAKKVTLQLDYGEMITVNGIVTDEKGMPLKGANILDSSNVYNDVITDKQGRFEIVLPQGADSIIAFHQKYAPKIIQLGNKNKKDMVKTSLEKGLPVYGKLADVKGRPISNAKVRVFYNDLVEQYVTDLLTDNDGNFSVESLSAENSVTFLFDKAGYVSMTKTLTPSEKLQTITLTRDPQINDDKEGQDIRPYDSFKVFRRIS